MTFLIMFVISTPAAYYNYLGEGLVGHNVIVEPLHYASLANSKVFSSDMAAMDDTAKKAYLVEVEA